MTERKWEIIQSHDINVFYDKITQYESEGYKLLPESFTISSKGSSTSKYFVLMLNTNFDKF